MRMFRKDEGFTLVELMVVVLIIGILVAIAIPVFNAASASARKSACISNLRTLDGAVEQWKAAAPTNDPGTWTISDAKTALTPYVADIAKSTVCPLGTGGSDSDGAYTLVATVGTGGNAGTAKFACPNAASADHKY